jgi:hypothetical protein
MRTVAQAVADLEVEAELRQRWRVRAQEAIEEAFGGNDAGHRILAAVAVSLLGVADEIRSVAHRLDVIDESIRDTDWGDD